MNIIEMNVELSKRDIIRMTRSAQKLKDVEAGCVIHPDKVLKYEDENKSGKTVMVLAIADEERGEVYSTTSPYFIDEFEFIKNVMGDEDFSIRTTRAASKSGREFNSCEII